MWRESQAPITAYFVQVVNVTDVQLDMTVLSLTVGGNAATLTATVAPNNATYKNVTWTTSDPTVATVANGVVTAVGAGTATITATATNGTTNTSDDKTATCTVTVNYTVTYVANNGSGETKVYNPAMGDAYCSGPVFRPDGMEFAAWLGDDGRAYRPGAPITESRTLTAQWQAPESSVPQNVPTEEWEYHGGGNTEDRAYRSSFAPMQGGRAMLVLNNGETANLMNIYPGTTVWVNPIPDPAIGWRAHVGFIDGARKLYITETKCFVMPIAMEVVFTTFHPSLNEGNPRLSPGILCAVRAAFSLPARLCRCCRGRRHSGRRGTR